MNNATTREREQMGKRGKANKIYGASDGEIAKQMYEALLFAPNFNIFARIIASNYLLIRSLRAHTKTVFAKKSCILL